MRWLLKFRWICSRGYGVMGVWIWRGLVTPIFSVLLAAKLCVRPLNILEVQERAGGPLSPCQIWLGSDFNPPPGWRKTSSFLFSVTLFVTSRFWTSEFVRLILPWRQWSTEMILMPLDMGRFVVVHACLTFWDCRQLSTSLNAEV